MDSEISLIGDMIIIVNNHGKQNIKWWYDD